MLNSESIDKLKEDSIEEDSNLSLVNSANFPKILWSTLSIKAASKSDINLLDRVNFFTSFDIIF